MSEYKTSLDTELEQKTQATSESVKAQEVIDSTNESGTEFEEITLSHQHNHNEKEPCTTDLETNQESLKVMIAGTTISKKSKDQATRMSAYQEEVSRFWQEAFNDQTFLEDDMTEEQNMCRDTCEDKGQLASVSETETDEKSESCPIHLKHVTKGQWAPKPVPGSFQERRKPLPMKQTSTQDMIQQQALDPSQLRREHSVPGAFAEAGPGLLDIRTCSATFDIINPVDAEARPSQSCSLQQGRNITNETCNNDQNAESDETAASMAQAEIVSDVEAVVYAKNVQKDMYKRNVIFCVLCGIFVVVTTVTLSLVLSDPYPNNDDTDPRCLIPIEELDHSKVPIVCMCRNTTKDFLPRLQPSEWELYDYLKTLLQSRGVMDPQLDFTHESCIPENQYLVAGANHLSYGRTQDHIMDETKQNLIIQLYALNMIYLKMEGVHWTRSDGWMVSSNACANVGINCLFLSVISEISLSNNKLVGTIPTEIVFLTSLRTIDLSNNAGIVGTIPSEMMGSSAALDFLDLSGTSISGSIPTEVGQLSRLDHLNLARNSLSGTIPTELGLLSIRKLGLSGNNLNGTVPSEIGNCSRLQMLRLQDNELTGSIPETLAKLEDLELLNIARNNFSGTIPSYLGTIKNLELINLERSGFTGSLPHSFCDSRQDVTINQVVVVQCEVTGRCSCCNNLSNNGTRIVTLLCIEKYPEGAMDDV